ncbi:MAG: MBL fold metallo-hydrolase [Bacteroidia bacterium]|nr:MBL fold metallo-hydrolase [Bacteroidia bacterium]
MQKTKTNKIKIQFLGAAGTVTGSKYLVEADNKKILVDCGLFQGLKELRQRNWDKMPFDVSEIDFVLLTHGHLDHVGYLPLLVKQGFKNNIYGTTPTIELAKLILLDSAKIQEEDANRANIFKYSKHKPAKPLYSYKEAEAAFPLFNSIPVDKWIDVDPNISFRFQYNGHILGACFIELKLNGKLIVFSGDIGRPEDPLLREPAKPKLADAIIIEATYGNRLHPPNAKHLLANEINKAVQRSGTIIIPSFAVERTQLLMFLLWQLKTEKKIPLLPIYMDSPMGTHVLEIFHHNMDWHKLTLEESVQMCSEIKIVSDEKETDVLVKDKTAKIIIASSGMATGGRVLSYFEKYLGDPTATILLAGYQSEGTRGRALLDGAKEIKMRGKFWPVKANISMIDGLSAHADQNELLAWLNRIVNEPSQLFVTHGEKESLSTLAEKIREEYNWNVGIPQLNQVIELH